MDRITLPADPQVWQTCKRSEVVVDRVGRPDTHNTSRWSSFQAERWKQGPSDAGILERYSLIAVRVRR